MSEVLRGVSQIACEVSGGVVYVTCCIACVCVSAQLLVHFTLVLVLSLGEMACVCDVFSICLCIKNFLLGWFFICYFFLFVIFIFIFYLSCFFFYHGVGSYE